MPLVYEICGLIGDRVTMKIAVTSTGPGLDDQVEPRFGRSPYFVIVDADTDTMNFETVQNPNTAVGGGAGVQSAKDIAEKGVEALLTGNCGPNAFSVLEQTGVDVITGVEGTVREAAEKYKAGELTPATVPSVKSHFGMDGKGAGGGRGMGQGR